MERLLITGAAGFIGRAAWERYRERWQLIGIDDLSRPTATPPSINDDEPHEFIRADINHINDFDLPAVDAVLHLAAKVSVTRSMTSPWADFRTNAVGTVRLIEWAKHHCSGPFLIASTNKVFGELIGHEEPITDRHPIAPRTPYGIAKAAGALYVTDLLPDRGYAFHQSCIYGEEQQGTVDQGWIGFVWRSIRHGWSITCYGDGNQVRDLLHVDDLLAAYSLALDGRLTPGQYVTGGGIANALTFHDAVETLGGTIHGYAPWRPCDQRYFVSANEGLSAAGWRPDVLAKERLCQWRASEIG